ncbi:MAG: UDP-N-acetylmuramoyl-tripeptide--D-alanyl-D-alanine ligase [Desulfohalobiaceae bacterium]
MKLTLSEVGQAIQAVGEYEEHPEQEVQRIQTDSRLVEPGDLFFCLQGENLDGHNFAREAVHKGALAVVSERPLWDLHIETPVLLVQNSLQALGKLAAYWRSKFQGRVVAVTGSAGKTTVKELLASILGQRGQVGKNYKNWNNELGLPLSILGFSCREHYWVLEAGISKKGDMDILGQMLCPDVALVVNVGPAHLQGLQDLAGVAREKTRLLHYLRPGGLGVASRDYPELSRRLPQREDMRLVQFSSKDRQAKYHGQYLGLQAWGKSAYQLDLDGQVLDLKLDLHGEFMLENLLAACSAAWSLGLDPEAIRLGLEQTSLPEHRGEVKRLGRFLVIDDCYNANPLSMRCALEHARAFAGHGELYLILGDMKELGDQAEQEHQGLGRAVAELGPGAVFYIGDYGGQFKAGYLQKGKAEALCLLQEVQEIPRYWRELEPEQGVLLIKASRGCRLERCLQLLGPELEK